MEKMNITSSQNERVKRVVALQQKSAERRRQNIFVVEGRREVAQCIEAGFEVVAIYYCPTMLPPDEVARLTSPQHKRLLIEVSETVYERMAYRGGTEGILAEVKPRNLTLDELKLGEAPLLLVVESVEKPGNLGAILRTADAAGATAVVVCDPLTDLYNPNLIRSSLGGIFSVPCVACSSEDCITYLKAHHITILTAQLQDSRYYYDTDMRRPTAIVMGTEATGLTDVWRRAADAHILIPMLGRIDSLNVSASAAILLYEAVRQRQQR